MDCDFGAKTAHAFLSWWDLKITIKLDRDIAYKRVSVISMCYNAELGGSI